MSSLQAVLQEKNSEKDKEREERGVSSLDRAAADASASLRRGSSGRVTGGRSSLSRSSLGGRSGYRGGGRGRGGRYGGRSGRGWISTGHPDDVPICKFFVQGRCSAGVNCRFRHTQEAAMVAARSLRQFPYAAPQYDRLHHHSPIMPPSPTNYLDAQPELQPDIKPRRQYSPVAAAAILHAKALQDQEPRSWDDLEPPFFSIDVECIATGTGHSASHRTPARIALVDQDGNTLLDEIVHFEEDDPRIVSYLTPLTGLTKSLCSRPTNKPLEDIIQQLTQILPPTATLIGQGIQQDIQWLQLQQGTHFKTYFDIALIFRQRIPKNIHQIVANAASTIDDDNLSLNSASSKGTDPPEEDLPTYYRVFSLRHSCLHLLGEDIQQSVHNPVIDAKYSLQLFLHYKDQSTLMIRATRDSLHRAPYTPSFSSQCPVIDQVCLSKRSYQVKHAARFIWLWWTSLFGGALLQKYKSVKSGS